MSSSDRDLHVGYRDAIHVPFIVVTCDRNINPGDKISLRMDDKCVLWGYGDGIEEPMWHGVVNPFLEQTVLAGKPFRVFIRPECFSRLRHDFTIETNDDGGTDTCHLTCDIS